MTSNTSTTDLLITRHFNAPPQAVFDAFSTIDAMKHWFGPKGCQVTGGDIDFNEGGNYRVNVATEGEGNVTLVGNFEEITPPNTLRYTWAWEGKDDEALAVTHVHLTFNATETGTTLTLHHTGFPSEDMRDHHNYGWAGCFDRLEKYVPSGE